MRGGRALVVCAALLPALAGSVVRLSAPKAGQTGFATLTLFTGSASGLWRSRDGGHEWERVRRTRGGRLESVGAVHAILPLSRWVFAGGDAGVIVSEDFGETWKEAGTRERTLCLLASQYLPVEPVLWAGTPGGLLRSDDNGASFRPTPVSGTPVYRLEWPGPALLVATGRGVLVSPDGGRNFWPPGAGLPEGDVRALARSSYFGIDPVVFAGVGSHGVFRSGDGGRSWAPSGLAGHTVTDLLWLGPLLYAVSDQGVFRSEDVGHRWTRLVEGLGKSVPSRLLFPQGPYAGAEAFLATDRGIYRTVDGGLRWQASGLEGERVHVIATFPPVEPPPVYPD